MNKRGAGILLHPTSLPSPYGVGDLGPSAYRFADFLTRTRQMYWQVLPLNPTSPVLGNSPYSSVSTFACNTLLISPDLLVEGGLLDKKEVEARPRFPEGRCDYEGAIFYKDYLLDLAYDKFRRSAADHDAFVHFCQSHASWLDTYALFVCIKKQMAGRIWSEWPRELRQRAPERIEAVRRELSADLEKEKFRQYLFFRQWGALKKYCNERGVQILGDIPIYVSYDSADAWANPSFFKLNEQQKPTVVAGVPPDYFSATGQLWGNPVYDWDALKRTGYAWWIERMGRTLALFDVVRIDHFRGLVAFWEVPAGETNAVNGRWATAPVRDLFDQLFKRFFDLPIIAEDLGIITPDVREAIHELGFFGMKVLLFAFGEDNPMHIYLPHTYEEKYAVYTGTHDNNTVKGWFETEARPDELERLFRYLGREVGSEEACWELIRLAMMSVARIAVFPLQDILCLGREARMNRPSIGRGNWEWRILPGQLTDAIADRLRSLTVTYGRA